MSTPTLAPRVRFQTPAVCHKAQPKPTPLLPFQLPTDLYGYVHWYDPDPLYPADLSVTLSLQLTGAPNHYYGTSAGETNYITCDLYHHAPTNLWHLDLWIYGLRVPPEDFEFSPFPINTAVPIDTGLLRWDNPVATGWRESRFRF